MNKNSKQSTGKPHSGAASRGIVVFFSLLAFIWMPAPEVDALVQLVSPSFDCETPNDPDLCVPTSTLKVTVFRWTQSDNPEVDSYRLIIADDPKMENIVLDLPGLGKSIIAPQVAVDLENDLGQFEGFPLYWRVIGLDQDKVPIEQSQEVFAFEFFTDPSGYTIIKGLVKSDLNAAGLAGARVAVSSAQHATSQSIAASAFNGEYIVIAFTTDVDENFDPINIPLPIELTYTKDGFKATTLEVNKTGIVTVESLEMESIADSDSDGISDAVENASPCPDSPRARADDQDTDDDGITDGEEDTNFNGIRESNETDPCESDTDRDLIQDGTERGYTIGVIDHTDTNIFQPDLDPTTTTNPLDDDSDNDGLLDGQEDKNRNGRVDADAGETDPNSSNRRARPHIPLLLLSD